MKRSSLLTLCFVSLLAASAVRADPVPADEGCNCSLPSSRAGQGFMAWVIAGAVPLAFLLVRRRVGK